MMTFYQKLQAHRDGLVKVNAPTLWIINQGPTGRLNGKIGIIHAVCRQRIFIGSNGRDGAIDVTLFIDGNVHTVILYEEDVEFLEGPQ